MIYIIPYAHLKIINLLCFMILEMDMSSLHETECVSYIHLFTVCQKCLCYCHVMTHVMIKNVSTYFQ